jgi:glucosamine 6-phosphate synthetase-like amidotransferase/phosphosugar isomerase protein
MCGIFGIVTRNKKSLGPILTEAARRGFDPDFPRNLSQTLTVD